jgi:hypothetical protein
VNAELLFWIIFEGDSLVSDRILTKYPESKPLAKVSAGYGYDFGSFRIVKNITGTGGWILTYDTPEEPNGTMYPFALEFDEAVKVGRDKTHGSPARSIHPRP